MSERDGGPAFPALDFIVPNDLEERHVHQLGTVRGMSLRDYFAAAYMSGRAGRPDGLEDYIQSAENAYRVADAMIAQRKAPAAVDPHAVSNTENPSTRDEESS
jgi:hypothetical protein